MKAHRLARYFPILEGEEFALLVKDIEEHGQLEPIVMVQGEILDGVNRYRACEQLGIDSIVEEYRGADPLSYVISLNIRRRHMDTSQRAMLATEMLPEFEKSIAEGKEERKDSSGQFTPLRSKDRSGYDREKESARGKAAKEFGVSGPTIQRAKRIKEAAPEKVDAIIRGEEKVTTVDAEIRKAKGAELAAKDKDRADEKERHLRPEWVKRYLEANKVYKNELRRAINCKQAGVYAPEDMQFVINRHEETIELFRDLEE